MYRRSPHGERGLKCRRHHRRLIWPPSLPSRGAWIEIRQPQDWFWRLYVAPLTGSVDWNSPMIPQNTRRNSRSPHGERGLKCKQGRRWRRTGCRSPHGERGLKLLAEELDVIKFSRSPHGERGLKYGSCLESGKPYWSLPSRGAWIEMQVACGHP